MSGVFPIIAWLLPMSLEPDQASVFEAGPGAFYALQRRVVLPEAVLLCLILLQAGASFRECTAGAGDEVSVS